MANADVSQSEKAFFPPRSGSSIMNSEPWRADDLPILAAALKASWDHQTSYQGITQPGNPAYGQCYPTSRVVQWFYPDYEIAKGDVWTGTSVEQHFWNVRGTGEIAEWLDLSCEQFPPGSTVRHFTLLNRHALGDSERARERCALLLQRVRLYLDKGHD